MSSISNSENNKILQRDLEFIIFKNIVINIIIINLNKKELDIHSLIYIHNIGLILA
jgi:hypothetical protein